MYSMSHRVERFKILWTVQRSKIIFMTRTEGTDQIKKQNFFIQMTRAYSSHLLRILK